MDIRRHFGERSSTAAKRDCGLRRGGRLRLRAVSEELFDLAARTAAAYRAGLPDRAVAPAGAFAEIRRGFAAPLDEAPTPAATVIRQLITAAEPGLMASAGPRFFGLVTGGALESATAAEMLAAGWDQCALNSTLAPAATAAEEVVGEWIVDLLGLPAGSGVGFVTGAQAGNTVGLASGREFVLRQVGWDVNLDGVYGAPRIRVIASVERHATIDRALRLLGLGERSLEPVAAGPNGEIDTKDLTRVLAAGAGPTIVCLQAGNVNTGAVDDLAAAIPLARRHGAWVHVDGAFGLWAAASPRYRHLTAGAGEADSWSCDGHKWLNLPYDSGFAICRDPRLQAHAVSYTASYLSGSGNGVAQGSDLTLESSRRARGFAAWAGLRELGRSGVADLVERCCTLARQLADELAAGGATVVNDVVLNQVLLALPGATTAEQVDAIAAGVQRGGVCWLGATTWRGRRYLRVAVSNASTTGDDVHRAAQAMLAQAGGSSPSPC